MGALGTAKGLAKVGVGALGFAGLGIAGGLAGIWFGIRKLLANPFDSREKRQLVAYGLSMSAMVIVFCVGILWLATQPGWIPHFLFSVAYMVGIGAACSWWMPRIVARRHAWEAEHDPVAAAVREAKTRRWGRLGKWLGFGLGSGGLLLGLWLSGRMG
jgi:hypothetical protein